ncbi:MAG: 2-hydroxyacyl-CoA dehydratase family protein [Spirochaetota bacterium]|nr:2-hydroxyacyl-CoA dehydratase family protein [Spirochaetota bacterium]
MGTLDTIKSILQNTDEIALEWKKDGKKVVGHRCLYIPEEIIHAAGMLPFPTFGTPDPIVKADSYFQTCVCEFVRNIFDLALEHKLDFLDSMVFCNTCDAVRHLYNMWDSYIDQVPCHMLNNPQKMFNESGYGFYRKELEKFIEIMEDLSGNKITDTSLQESIKLYDETRGLLKELNSLRKRDVPPFTGSEFLQITMAAMYLPKEKANAMLKELLKEVDSREIENADGPRILITGSIIDNPGIIKMVEDVEGVVVADDLCSSTKYFWYQTESNNDPLDAIVKFNMNRCVCCTMFPIEKRYDFLKEQIDEFNVEGVIYFNIKYCHPCVYESFTLKDKLEEDVPVLTLEAEHNLSGMGQLKTRVQAFIEML